MLISSLVIIGLVTIAVVTIVLLSYITHKRRGLSYDADFVRKMLPGVDCGVCGEKNCVEFAKMVAEGKREPEECKLIKPENSQKIKKFFKPTYKEHTKRVAFVRCKGGCKAENEYYYEGSNSCSVQEMLHSGSKACKYACLGCGDCVKACRYRAIKITDRKVAEVIRSKCTGCGKCVNACPNGLIEMNKLELSVGVVCNNKSTAPAIEKKCVVGCKHCGACVKICPVGAIDVVDNIPVIDPDKCIECGKCVSICPNHVISRLY